MTHPSLQSGSSFVAATLFALLAWAGQAYAQNDLPVLNAGYITFPPIAYTDADGNAQGSIIDLTNALAADSGYQINWINYPINRIYHSLSTGDIDFWPGSPAVPALQNFTLSSKPLGISVKLCAFSLPDQPVLNNPNELADKQLVLIRGYTYRGQLEKVFDQAQYRPIVAPDHAAAMELLVKGRGQYLISYGHPMQQVLQDYPLRETRCNPLDEWPLVYVISLRNPQAQLIADKLDAALARHLAAQQAPAPEVAAPALEPAPTSVHWAEP
ncbi:MAG: transporter substrate-binding domain-containing protein [Halopseudomonas sp.]|uniref:substrate-binding periplasmic protein n=1 Tax=Halopseudomonas sp. TaxID=2901191 RepID=UPI003001CE8A